MRGRAGGRGRAVATVFFTDMVGSTELAARFGDRRWREVLAVYQRVVRQALRSGGGREVDSAGDGLFAVFDSPGAALRCAARLTDTLHRRGIEVRTGVHMGEVEMMAGGVGGIAVHLGARVAAQAGPGEILVTGTVRDVMVGSDMRWAERGTHEFKGVPGRWPVYAVERPEATPLDLSALDAMMNEQSAARRRRPLLVAVASAGVVLAIAIALLVALRAASSSSPLLVPGPDTVSHLSRAKGGFVAAVRTGGTDPIQVTTGANAVWVVDYRSGTLVRVDAGRAGVEDTRAVSGTPTGVAYGDGALWLTTLTGGGVLHFNLSTQTFDAVVPVGDGARGLAVDGDAAVWTTNSFDDTLVAIDPATRGIVRTVSLGMHEPTSVAVGGGLVWIGCADGALIRYDPGRDRITAFDVGVPIDAVAVGPNALWAASTSGSVVIRIDPSTGDVVTTVHVDGGPDSVVASGTDAWVTASRAKLVDRIEVADNTVAARYAVGGIPHGVALDGDGVWVAVAAQ